MRSVFALERNSKGELQDVGRDIKPHWVLTMEELESEGGGVIFADVSSLSSVYWLSRNHALIDLQMQRRRATTCLQSDIRIITWKTRQVSLFTRLQQDSDEVRVAPCNDYRVSCLTYLASLGTFAPSYANRESVRPELLFATTSGALGVILDLGDVESKILSDLQRNMDEVCSGPGITWKA
jgi:hypothetical protein